MNHEATKIPGLFFVLFVSLWFTNNLFAANNVLLISIDTLRADHLGCYGGANKTPNIDALASRGAQFQWAISQVPLTLPSHCTILSGLYPDQHGVRNNESFVLPDRIQTLAESFKKNGYSTGAVVGSFSLDSIFGIQQGFDFYEDRIGKGKDPVLNRHVERKAETVWKLGREWLDRQKGTWFCFLHFFDPHTGYNPPSGFPQTYDGEIQYVDGIIGQISRYLEEKKLSANTFVVLVSDHGESLGEHGEASHGVFLYDATLHVPFLISGPGIKPGKISSQVRLVDVAPTIAALTGLQSLPQFSGRNLIPWLQSAQPDLIASSESFYTNLLMGWAPLHSVRMPSRKWIDAPKPELYDLKQDPAETKNVFTAAGVPFEFKKERKARDQKPAASNQAPVDRETQEKLASLGYVTGSSSSAVSSGFDPKDGIAVWNQIEIAVSLAQRGDLEKSEKTFEEVLKRQPDNVIAQKFLAGVLRKRGKSDAAIQLLKQALKSPLHQEETVTELAEIYYDLAQYQNVLDHTEIILRKNPENRTALMLAAFSNLQLKKYQVAQIQFAAVLKKDPEQVESLSGYARASTHLSQDKEALRAYERLSRLRPLEEQEALQAAGLALTSKNITLAEDYFRMAVQAEKTSAGGWKGLGLIFASRKEWDKALEAFLNSADCINAKKVASNLNPVPPELAGRLANQCK